MSMCKFFTTLLLVLLCVVYTTKAEALELKTDDKLYSDALDLLTRRIHAKTQIWITNSEKYIHMIQSIFLEEGIPVRLAYLPFVESGFNPHAISRAGAVGLWQFMESTGRRYGLKITKRLDERKDPVKSTYAAAKYLKDLYRMFGSWELALAAYNGGENRIHRISLKTNDVFSSRLMPHETKRYVPLFRAAVEVMENSSKYGFRTKTAEKQLINLAFLFLVYHQKDNKNKKGWS